ncbi:hypothetical protein IQ26_07417 [Mesorhizobium tianshanense]|uniref:Uncharacterized protein n=1 Tax=Mesorhizobium tianshanense TaxID=39844 RepID=A0A562MDH4_9HYPH|nr:hypothetical protein IQ26_07417 [Mesorhizobium tianshanense]
MFESAVQAITWRFTRDPWQVMSPLPSVVSTLPFRAAPIIEIP